jgi:hypothetical protein
MRKIKKDEQFRRSESWAIMNAPVPSAVPYPVYIAGVIPVGAGATASLLDEQFRVLIAEPAPFDDTRVELLSRDRLPSFQRNVPDLYVELEEEEREL